MFGIHPNGVSASVRPNFNLVHPFIWPVRILRSMRAVTIPEFGGPEVLTIAELPDPKPQVGEVLIDVAAAGVNRADLLQRTGNYPPPAGAPEWPGLECAGTITALGEGVTGWQVGQRVMALLAGGGYAEQVAVPAGQIMPIPDGLDFAQAAAIPEALATAWANLKIAGGLKAGDDVLIVGGSGGVGSLAIQLANSLGARVITTAGGSDRAKRCRELGAAAAIDYRSQNIVEAVNEFTNGRGVDVILDVLGAGALSDNVDMLATDGILVIIGLQKGAKGELNLGKLMAKRARVTGTTLRSRSVAEKSVIVAEASACALPWYESGKLKPIVHAEYALADAAQAHRDLDSGQVFGKLILRP